MGHRQGRDVRTVADVVCGDSRQTLWGLLRVTGVDVPGLHDSTEAFLQRGRPYDE